MPPLTLPFQCLLVYLYHFLNDSLSGDSYSFLISRTGGITLPYPSLQCLQLHTRRTRPAPYHFLNELLSGDSYREILSGQDQTTPLLLCSGSAPKEYRALMVEREIPHHMNSE